MAMGTFYGVPRSGGGGLAGFIAGLTGKEPEKNPAFGAKQVEIDVTDKDGNPTGKSRLGWVNSEGKEVSEKEVKKFGVDAPFKSVGGMDRVLHPSKASMTDSINTQFRLAPFEAEQKRGFASQAEKEAYDREMTREKERIKNSLKLSTGKEPTDEEVSLFASAYHGQNLTPETYSSALTSKKFIELGGPERVGEGRRSETEVAAKKAEGDVKRNAGDKESALAAIQRSYNAKHTQAQKSLIQPLTANTKAITEESTRRVPTEASLFDAKSSSEIADLRDKELERPSLTKVRQAQLGKEYTMAHILNLGDKPKLAVLGNNGVTSVDNPEYQNPLQKAEALKDMTGTTTTVPLSTGGARFALKPQISQIPTLFGQQVTTPPVNPLVTQPVVTPQIQAVRPALVNQSSPLDVFRQSINRQVELENKNKEFRRLLAPLSSDDLEAMSAEAKRISTLKRALTDQMRPTPFTY